MILNIYDRYYFFCCIYIILLIIFQKSIVANSILEILLLDKVIVKPKTIKRQIKKHGFKRKLEGHLFDILLPI